MIRPGEALGNHSGQSQQSRLELALRFRRRFSRASDLDCGRASRQRSAVHRAWGLKVDSISSIGSGD